MRLRKHLKTGIKLIIESDANPLTIVIRLSKGQLIKALDVVLPDDTEPTETQEKGA